MRILFALLVVCVAAAAVWAVRDQPLFAPNWSAKLDGVSYNPSHLYQMPSQLPGGPRELEDIIRGDLKHLGKVTTRIRTYSVNDGLDRVPYLARQFGLKVAVGLWLSDDVELNEAEIARLRDERLTALLQLRDNPSALASSAFDRLLYGRDHRLRIHIGRIGRFDHQAGIVEDRQGVGKRGRATQAVCYAYVQSCRW